MKMIDNLLFDKKIKLLQKMLQGESYKEYNHKCFKGVSNPSKIKIITIKDKLIQKLQSQDIFDKNDFDNITHLIIPDLSWISLMKVTKNIKELLLDDLTLSKDYVIISKKYKTKTRNY